VHSGVRCSLVKRFLSVFAVVAPLITRKARLRPRQIARVNGHLKT
jgi:hypothetical protein